MKISSKENDITLVLCKSFNAPKNKLFSAWKEASHLKYWLSPGDMTVSEVDVSFNIGGNFIIIMQERNGETHTATGIYTKIVENSKIAFNWNWPGTFDGETLVTVEFKESKAGTEIVLLQEFFKDRASRDKQLDGWMSCFSKLLSFTASNE